MKRIHSIHEDANSNCGCSEALMVLKAPMTNSDIPAIGERIDISMDTAEFTRDITEIVKKWLDGSVVNNGLLLLAGELPCTGGRRCCFMLRGQPGPGNGLIPGAAARFLPWEPRLGVAGGRVLARQFGRVGARRLCRL